MVNNRPALRTTVSFIKLYPPSSVRCGVHNRSIRNVVVCSSGMDREDTCRANWDRRLVVVVDDDDATPPFLRNEEDDELDNGVVSS